MKLLSFLIAITLSVFCFSQDTREIVLTVGDKFLQGVFIENRTTYTPKNTGSKNEISMEYFFVFQYSVNKIEDDKYYLTKILTKATVNIKDIANNVELKYNSDIPNLTNDLSKSMDEILLEPEPYILNNDGFLKPINTNNIEQNKSFYINNTLEMLNVSNSFLYMTSINDKFNNNYPIDMGFNYFVDKDCFYTVEDNIEDSSKISLSCSSNGNDDNKGKNHNDESFNGMGYVLLNNKTGFVYRVQLNAQQKKISKIKVQ
ncbi:MAG: hypothetical protein LC122_01735 [Chitinophagales bacterium]|nr:hypothetical protein [Chitinophagales bacterium]